MEFDFDPEELMRQQDEAAQSKRNLALVGGIGDALASQQSFGNFLTGKMNPASTSVSRTAGAIADSVEDPLQRQAKLYAGYKQSQEAKSLAEQSEVMKRKRDPTSRESMALKALAPRWGIQVTPEMSASEIEQMIDPRKMMETEATSRISNENQKSLQDRDFEQKKMLKGMDLEGDLRKTLATRDSKEATEAQSKAALFAQRIQNSEKIMEDLSKEGFDGNDRRSWVQKNLFNEAKPVPLQKMEQAQRNFVNAVLRRESGAAISPEEFDSARIQYFPQPGDAPELLEQKRQNRLDVLAGLQAESGKALGALTAKREGLESTMPSPKRVVTNEDNAAIEWATKNPSDPRSQKILERNGVKIGAK